MLDPLGAGDEEEYDEGEDETSDEDAGDAGADGGHDDGIFNEAVKQAHE